MASTTRDELISGAATAVNAPAAAWTTMNNAKLMVATSRGGCQGLKDLLSKEEDATTMVVVMATNNPAPATKPPSSSPLPASMHPMLAEAACQGNREELNFILNGEEVQVQPSMMPGRKFRDRLKAYESDSCPSRSLAVQRCASDVEEGVGTAAWLLKGVTAEGDTALHLVAANGDADKFLDCANLIYSKDKTLLMKPNKKGDTPLHCAARVGNTRMVSRLISLAKDDNIVQDLLRMENNDKETALHEVIRFGGLELVQVLLAADRELACYPEEGSSPLYLAVLLGEENIARALYDESKDHVLSFSGPNGQNALYAAVMRGPVLTRMLLGWNKNLATERDANGSTPLHFAAGRNLRRLEGSECMQLLRVDTGALYQPDNNGLYPIHVAASVGATDTASMFIEKSASCAGLRDAKGRTFLHLAVEKNYEEMVRYACRNALVSWILNMQDNEGNTALHLAVQTEQLVAFSALYGNRQVKLNLTNAKGQTPLAIAWYKLPRGMYYTQNSGARIYSALRVCSWLGVSRKDHFRDGYNAIHGSDDTKELEGLKNSTQAFSIGSVLIVTVTFGATFALPGGYKADDHTNGGSPTLSGRYAFDAFMLANTLAFICSAIATVGFMYSGSPFVDLWMRKAYLATSEYFMETSISALTAAFALAAYMVLAPVAPKTAITICAASPLVVLWTRAEFFWKGLLLFRPFYTRMGPKWTFVSYAIQFSLFMLLYFWPVIFVFGWAVYTRHHVPKQ